MDELNVIVKMVELMHNIPTGAESWIEPKEDVPVEGAISEVTLKIAGMPMRWKLFNGIFVIGSKLMLWKLTCETGVTFLMQTSGIDDIIINSVGLTFIMNLDELIYKALMSEETAAIVAGTDVYELFDEKTSCIGDMSLLTDDEILEKHGEAQGSWSWGWRDALALLPIKLLGSLFLTSAYVFLYYFDHCVEDNENPEKMVSQPMYVPKSVDYNFMNAFFPYIFPLESEATAYWKMPNVTRR